MNSCKRRILKSEEVRIILSPKRTGRESGDMGDSDPPPGPGDRETRSAIENAYRDGVAEGRVAGRKEAEQELDDALRLVRDLTARVSRLRAEILSAAEKDIVTLALAMAEKIVHQELTTNRDTVKAIFRSALEAIGERDRLQVRCNPADLEILQAYLLDLRAAHGGLDQVDFIADPALTPGGVKIESSLCEVDASIESRLAMMKNVLFA